MKLYTYCLCTNYDLEILKWSTKSDLAIFYLLGLDSFDVEVGKSDVDPFVWLAMEHIVADNVARIQTGIIGWREGTRLRPATGKRKPTTCTTTTHSIISFLWWHRAVEYASIIQSITLSYTNVMRNYSVTFYDISLDNTNVLFVKVWRNLKEWTHNYWWVFLIPNYVKTYKNMYSLKYVGKYVGQRSWYEVQAIKEILMNYK